MAQTTAPAPSRPVRNSLISRQLPTWLPWAIGVAAVLVAAAIVIPISGGFNLVGIVILAGVLNAIALYLVSRSIEGPRKATDRFVTVLVSAAFIIAVVPLISLLWTVIVNGAPHFTLSFLTRSMNGLLGSNDVAYLNGENPLMGGIYHAIIGTVMITIIATVIAVPIGVLTAIYLVEYGNKNRLSQAITFFVDVMTGVPSIVAGLFAFALFSLVFGPGTKTGLVAGVSLAVLMIPVVVRATEEMLRLVPADLREASLALGVPKWVTILKVVLPTSISGIISGITIAIARVIGETAPIVITAGFTNSVNWNPFSEWMSSLPVYIYYQVIAPTSPRAAEVSMERAWMAALVLIVIVMLLNLAARLIGRIFAPKSK